MHDHFCCNTHQLPLYCYDYHIIVMSDSNHLSHQHHHLHRNFYYCYCQGRARGNKCKGEAGADIISASMICTSRLFSNDKASLLHFARMRVTQFRLASWFVLGFSVTLGLFRGMCETWMDILWVFESLPDAVSRFCSDFLGFGTN